MKEILLKLKETLNNTGNRKKSIENLVIFLVITVIIISCIGYIFSEEETKVETYSSVDNIFDPEVFEDKLNNILSNIEGAGNVEVMIAYRTGVETVPLLDTKDNKTITEDNTGGAIRRTQQDLIETSIIFNQENNGSKEPYISKTIMPQVEGVIVTCEGGGDTIVKNNIIKAVQAVTGIEAGKIQVFSKNIKKK